MRVQLLPPQHWRVRLGVRTLASQAGNTGSIPVRATESICPVSSMDRTRGYGPRDRGSNPLLGTIRIVLCWSIIR